MQQDKHKISTLHDLINDVQLLLDTPTEEKNFLNTFSTLLPIIKDYLRFRTSKFGDESLKEEEYDESRSPVAAIFINYIEEVIASENINKQEILKNLFKTGTMTPLPDEDSENHEKQQLITSNESITIKKRDEFFSATWQAIKEITGFYYNNPRKPDPSSKWLQMFTEQLFDHSTAKINKKLHSKIVNDLINLIQAFASIDQNIIDLLHSIIINDEFENIPEQEKIALIFKFFKTVFTEGYSAETKDGKQIIISAIQKEEYIKTEQILDGDLHYLAKHYHVPFDKFKKDCLNFIRDDDLALLSIEEGKPIDINAIITKFSKIKNKPLIIKQGNTVTLFTSADNYQQKYELDLKVFKDIKFTNKLKILTKDNVSEKIYREISTKTIIWDSNLTPRNLFYLKRDLKYYLKKKILTPEQNGVHKRLKRIKKLLNHLGYYCGEGAQFEKSSAPEAKNHPDEKTHQVEYFNPKLYQDKSTKNHREEPWYWQQLTTPLKKQQRRTHKSYCHDVSSVIAGPFALDEGAVAGNGFFNFFSSLGNGIAGGILGIFSFICGTRTNYLTVQPSIEATLNTLTSTEANTDDDDSDIADEDKPNKTKERLKDIAIATPCAISALCYVGLGTLSAWQLIIGLLLLCGVGAIPIAGQIIILVLASIAAISMFKSIFGLLYTTFKQKLKTIDWDENFYWPTEGTKLDKLRAVLDNTVNAIKVLLAGAIALTLFGVGIKLFALNLVTAMGKITTVTRAINTCANVFAYINSTLFLYFNFKKGATLLDTIEFTPRGLCKLIAYPIETSVRLLCFIPAAVCKVAQAVTWFFSDDWSDYFKNATDFWLKQTSPLLSAKVLNKYLPSKTHSGVDERTEESREPIALSLGIARCTWATIKAVFYLSEIGVRASIGIGYKLLWPLRWPCRKIYNAVAKHYNWRPQREIQVAQYLTPTATIWFLNGLQRVGSSIAHGIKSGINWLRGKNTVASTTQPSAENVAHETIKSAQDKVIASDTTASFGNAAGYTLTTVTEAAKPLQDNLHALHIPASLTVSSSLDGTAQGVSSFMISEIALTAHHQGKGYRQLPIVNVKSADLKNVASQIVESFKPPQSPSSSVAASSTPTTDSESVVESKSKSSSPSSSTLSTSSSVSENNTSQTSASTPLSIETYHQIQHATHTLPLPQPLVSATLPESTHAAAIVENNSAVANNDEPSKNAENIASHDDITTSQLIKDTLVCAGNLLNLSSKPIENRSANNAAITSKIRFFDHENYSKSANSIISVSNESKATLAAKSANATIIIDDSELNNPNENGWLLAQSVN